MYGPEEAGFHIFILKNSITRVSQNVNFATSGCAMGEKSAFEWVALYSSMRYTVNHRRRRQSKLSN